MAGCSLGVCLDAVDKLRSSVKLSKLLGGGTLSDVNISCRPCSSDGPEGGARAVLLDSEPLEIVLCTNRLSGKAEIDEVVVHELIHVFDHRTRRCDLETCHGLAYSEVRAAREAECNRYFPFKWLKSECVRHNAVRSTANLYPHDAAKCVDAVFDTAILDLAPFDVDTSRPK